MMVKLLTMGIQPTIMENKKRQTQNVQIITCSNIVTCGILHDVLRSVSSCGSQCKWDLHNGTICEIFVKNTKHVDSYIHYVYIYMYIYIYPCIHCLLVKSSQYDFLQSVGSGQSLDGFQQPDSQSIRSSKHQGDDWGSAMT